MSAIRPAPKPSQKQARANRDATKATTPRERAARTKALDASARLREERVNTMVDNGATFVEADAALTPQTRTLPGVTLRDLLAAGVVDAGRVLTAKYKGQTFSARLLADGTVEWDGTVYASPSLAAGMVRKSVIGAPNGYAFPQTNGWTFWFITDESGDLRPLASLREGRSKTVVAESAPRAGRLPDPEKAGKVRRAKATLDAIDALGGPAYVEAIGTDEAQAALTTLAEASIGAERTDPTE